MRKVIQNEFKKIDPKNLGLENSTNQTESEIFNFIFQNEKIKRAIFNKIKYDEIIIFNSDTKKYIVGAETKNKTYAKRKSKANEILSYIKTKLEIDKVLFKPLVLEFQTTENYLRNLISKTKDLKVEKGFIIPIEPKESNQIIEEEEIKALEHDLLFPNSPNALEQYDSMIALKVFRAKEKLSDKMQKLIMYQNQKPMIQGI